MSATERFRNEMDAAKDENITVIGSAIIRYLERAGLEDSIPEDKTLAGCNDYLRECARKRKKGNVGVAGFDDVFDYFGLSGDSLQAELPESRGPVKKADINIDDLFT